MLTEYQHQIRRSQFDVVVVGSGISGLVCAAHLVHAGLSVLVLEQHGIPGGATSVFQRRGFIFEAAGHRVTGIRSAGGPLFEILRAIGRRVETTSIDPSYVVRIGDRRLEAALDLKTYRQNLLELFPREKDAIDSFFADMLTIKQALDDIASARGQLDLQLLSTRHPLFLESVTKTTQDFVADRFPDPEIVPFLTTPGAFSTHPIEEQAFAFFARVWVAHHTGEGMSLVHGGTKTLVDALVEYIDTHGGQVVVRKMVDQVLVEDGRAIGTVTVAGDEVRGRAIVSAASDEQTFLRMLGAEQLPSEFSSDIRAKRPTGGLFQVYLGVAELDGRGLENVTTFASEAPVTYDTRRDAWDLEAMTSGAVISVQGSEMAPEGYRAINISCPCPYEHPENWFIKGSDKSEYRAFKDMLARKLIGKMARFVPELENRIEYVETATPLTVERYTLATKGGIHGLANTVELSGPQRGSIQTPVDGYYHVGQYVFPGGGIVGAAISGELGARTVLTNHFQA